MITTDDFKPSETLLFHGWHDKPMNELENAWSVMSPEQRKQLAFTAIAEYNALKEWCEAMEAAKETEKAKP